MKAWVFQNASQKARHGENAPWIAGWLDPSGKRKSKTCGTLDKAEKFARRIEAQLEAGVYMDASRKKWADFRIEFEAKVIEGMTPGTAEANKIALDHFERLVSPKRLQAVTTKTIADYVARRRKERRRRDNPESPLVAAPTINRELRCLRAILRKANRWGYLPRVPEFEFLREPGKLPTYVSPETFAKLYEACDDTCNPSADWWRGLLTMAYMTGWRIGALLALKRSDVDLEAGTAFSGHADNKGKRDDLIPLHPVVVEHLEKLAGFSVEMFPWPHCIQELRKEFRRIQKAAGVKPSHGKDHYGFHDLRRGFATMNHGRMTGDELQRLMQHKSYATTQRYIALARRLTASVGNLYVPEVATLKVAR